MLRYNSADTKEKLGRGFSWIKKGRSGEDGESIQTLRKDGRRNLGRRSFKQQCISENWEQTKENVSKYKRNHVSSNKGLVLIINLVVLSHGLGIA